MTVPYTKSVLFEVEEKLAKINEIASETEVDDPLLVGDTESPDKEMTAPLEDVLEKTDDEMRDVKLGRSEEEAQEITSGQKKEVEDSPSVKAADDQTEVLKVPKNKDQKEGKKDTSQKEGARVVISEEIPDTRQEDTMSLSSRVSGLSSDIRTLDTDDSTSQKKESLNMDHEILSIDIEDVKKDFSDTDSLLSFKYSSYIFDSDISMKPEFLLNMQISLPSISDINDTSEESKSEDQTLLDGEIEVVKDTGKFVDPLTGEDISSSESTETQKESFVDSEGIDLDHEDSSDVDIEIQSIISDKEIKVITMEEEYETALGILRQSMLKVPPRPDDDVDMIQDTRNRLLVHESTVNFLRGIIDRIVLEAETTDENAILEASLDKQLVLNEIYNQVLQYEAERRNLQYLSTKIVDHYRRAKNLRPILIDPVSSRQKLFLNFRKSLHEFDLLLERKRYVMQMHNEAMNADTNLLLNTNEVLADTHKKFEELVNNTFIRSKSSAKWKSKIETFLRKVDLKLKEISAERLILIRKQHTLSEAMEKLEKVENITPSFTMSAYERMIANVMKLGSILHDNHASVLKVRKETCNHWHLISHMREHRNLLQIQIRHQAEKYKSLCEKHKNMRDYICKLKVKHVALQHELSELSFNVGLLDKPLLMHDYDITKDAYDKLNVVVDDLRKQYEKIQRANELKSVIMKKRAIKKSESKFNRIRENVSLMKISQLNESYSFEKSIQFGESFLSAQSSRFNESFVLRNPIRSTENIRRHIKTLKFD